MSTGADRIWLCDGTVDLTRRAVYRGGEAVRLTRNEVELLRVVVERGGEAVSRDELHTTVFGVSPRVTTRAADQTVTRLRKKIESEPARPRHLVTVRGEGYCWVRHTPPSNALPRYPDRTVGRDALLSALEASLVAGPGLVTLVGPPGIGKTRLALVAAERSGLPGVVCELVGVRAEALDGALAHALGVRRPDLAAALGASPERVVVLDNLEHLLPAAADQVASWCAASPRIRWLATSREAMGLGAERVVEVGPLAQAAAIELFTERASALGVDALDEALVATVCETTEGWPLAVELAAGRLKAMGLDEVRVGLDDPLTTLRSDRRDVPPRHAGMAEAVQWSWALLNEAERDAMRSLAAFRGSFDRPGARAVIGGPRAAEHLDRLIARSLVEVRRDAGRARYRLPSAIHAFARQDRDRPTPPAWRRHATHVLARELGPAEMIELAAVSERFDGALGAAAALRLAEQDSLQDTETRLLLLGQAVDVGDAQTSLAARLSRAHLAGSLGRYELADEDLRRAGESAEGVMRTRLWLERAGVERHRAPALARELALEAAGWGAASGDGSLVARAERVLGVLALEAGEWKVARQRLQAGAVAAERADEPELLAVLYADLGNLLMNSSLPESARAYRDAIGLHERCDDLARVMIARSNLAFVEHLRGHLEHARALQEQALEIHQRLGNRRFEAFARAALGALALELGETIEAERHLLFALALLRDLDPTFTAYVEARLGALALELGDDEVAQSRFDAARHVFERRGLHDAVSGLVFYGDAAVDSEPTDAFAQLGLRLRRARERRNAEP